MGKVKGFVQDFLEQVGYDMGYDWDNLPSMAEMEDLMNQPQEPSDDELREIEAVSLYENGDIDNFDFMEGLS